MMKEAVMTRRFSILIIILAVLFSFSLHAQKDARLRSQNQKYINEADSLPERVNRMGEVFVQALKKEVEDIIEHNKWQEYRLRDKKIYLFISFKKVESARDVTLGSILTPGEKSLNLLRIVVYDMLANAIKSAINHDEKLKNYIVTLSVDPQLLKAAIAETGDTMYNPARRLDFARMDSMNANYHFFFEAFKNTNKIALSGRADIIEINHEIASTFNYEMEAKELFEKYFQTPFKETGQGNKIIIDFISCKDFNGQSNIYTEQVFKEFLSILSSDDHYREAGKDDIVKPDKEAMIEMAEKLKKKFGKQIELGQWVDSTEAWKQKERYKSNRLLMVCQAGDKAGSIVNKIFFSVTLISSDGRTAGSFAAEWYKLY